MIEGIGSSSNNWPRSLNKKQPSSEKVIGDEVVIVKGNNIDLSGHDEQAWYSPAKPATDTNFLRIMFKQGYDLYYKSSIL